jgi:hypothetical protein
MNTYNRTPEDDIEQQLLEGGWNFSGLSLFTHPNHRGSFSKLKAFELLDIGYCRACGACGEAGCCPPSKCLCKYGEVYMGDYRELEAENEKMQTIIENIRYIIDGSLVACDEITSVNDLLRIEAEEFLKNDL